MPKFNMPQTLSCTVILVAVSCAGLVTAQSIEIVTNSGSRIFLAPDSGNGVVATFTVQPSESGPLPIFHVAPRDAVPLSEERPAAPLITVQPAPLEPIAITPVDEPFEVSGQHRDFSVAPTPPDVGRQIAEALIREEVIRLRLNFDFDSANLQPNSLPMIETIANALRTDPSLMIEVQGHTDNVGSQEYNQNLSVRRAHEVRRILIELFGIEEWRITSAGYGMSRPADPLDTDEARAANRRVEIHTRAN